MDFRSSLHTVVAFLKLLFALLTLSIGAAIVLWVCYNELIQRLPEYERPPLVGVFGVAPIMILVGLYWAYDSFNVIRGK
jgi:hypothetical protein